MTERTAQKHVKAIGVAILSQTTDAVVEEMQVREAVTQTSHCESAAHMYGPDIALHAARHTQLSPARQPLGLISIFSFGSALVT